MIIKNNSNVDIINYPINFHTYSLKAGESVDLPEDASKHILKTYGFCEEVKGAPSIAKAVKAEAKKEDPKEEDSDAESKDYESMSYKELQSAYTAETGKKAIGLKKEELLSELL